MYNISNSDMKAMSKCEYRWFYERYLNLIPINGLPDVMEIGTFGHSLMEAAFETIKAGGSYEDAIGAAGKLLLDVIDKPHFGKVYRNVCAFVAYAMEQGWEVVDVEEKFCHPVTETTAFGFQPDLTIRFTRGTLRGQTAIVDYKFTGQYWTQRQIEQHQQVPKYIIYKNLHTGSNITRGAIVMLNTRATAKDDDLFRVAWVPMSKQRNQVIIRENELWMRKIELAKRYGDEHGADELKKVLTHTADELNCKMCHFADDICPMDIRGQDTKKTLERNYTQNTGYGYNGETDAT